MNNRALRQASERTCSALLINCCQLSLCLVHNAYVVVTAPPKAASWMNELIKSDPSIKLRDLAVPGTHDSASYTIAGWKPFSAVGRTQSLTVSDQLMSGARYLDIRFAGASGDQSRLSIWHGCLEGGDLQGILEEIESFLERYEGEFLVLELVPEFGRALTAEQKDAALQLAKDVFGERIFPGNDMKELLERMTLSELKEQKKQVVVLLHSRFFENYTNKTEEDIVQEFGIAKSQRWMRSKWYNTRVNQQLLDGNLEELERCQDCVFVNNQFVLTPGVGGKMDILAALTGQNTLQPMAMASRLYTPCVLDTYLRSHADKKWNLLMLDCIDRCPIVVQFAIALNFPTELDVKRAVACRSGAEASDVTESVQSLVSRKRVLLLTQISDDLKLPYRDGVLSIAYQLGDRCEVLTIDFDRDTQLLVSEFACTKATKVRLKKEDKSEGYVVRDQVLSEAPRDNGEGPVLHFKYKKDKGFEFPE